MLGGYVLQNLKGQGVRAICLSRSRPKNLTADAVWHEFDLTDLQAAGGLGRLCEDASEIWHVGAMLPGPDVTNQLMFDANVRSVQCLAEFAIKKRLAFRFISGATVYANPHAESICEGAALSPNGFGGFYGSTKYLAEEVLEYYSKQGLKVTILRPSSIYGKGMSSTKLVSRYLSLATANSEITIEPPFDQSFNLVFASDVADLLLSVSQNDSTGIFNIGGFNYSICEIARACIDVAASGTISLNETKKTGTSPSPKLLFDLDDSKVRGKLGFQKRTSIHMGLSSMVANSEKRGCQ